MDLVVGITGGAALIAVATAVRAIALGRSRWTGILIVTLAGLLAVHAGAFLAYIVPERPRFPVMVELLIAVVLVIAAVGLLRNAGAARLGTSPAVREFADALPVGLFRTDAKGNCLWVNDGWCAIAGLSTEQALGTGWIRAIAEEDRARLRTEWEDAVAERRAFHSEYRFRTPTGVTTWVLGNARPERSGGRVTYTGAITPIGGRKEDERALRDSEERYRSVIAAMSEGVVMMDASGEIVTCNAAAEESLGLTRDELTQRNVIDPRFRSIKEDGSPFPPEEYPIIRALRSGRPCTNVVMGVHHPDDTLRWLLLNSQPLWQPDASKPYAAVASFADITERMLAEERLRVAEHRYRLLFEQSPYAVIVFDTESLLPTEFNALAPKLLGYTSDEFAKLKIHDLDANESPIETRAHVQRVLETGFDEFETRVHTKSGELRDAVVSLRIIEIDGRQQLHAVLRDITARRQAEQALQESQTRLEHAQRMEAVGQLASGVAHDFNNLLTAIRGHAELARMELQPEDSAWQPLARVEEAARRAEGVTRSLLTFSHRGTGEAHPVRLAGVVARSARLLERTLPANIELEVDTAPGAGAWVMGDPDQLGQVVMNFAINARDAMPEGGTLGICLRSEEANGEAAEVVELIVSDTGVGIPAEILPRVFEPYFTTKARGKGTGLGLSIIHGIVESHGGTIRVESEPGRGTTFTVELPCLLAAPEAHEEVRPSVAGYRVTGNVLVAEDDSLVSHVLVVGLGSIGLHVVHVADGGEALERFSEDPEAFRLLVLDHDLPGLVGVECARRVRAQGSPIPILVVSGAPEIEVSEIAPPVMLLRKPFSIADLTSHVADLLSGGGANPLP